MRRFGRLVLPGDRLGSAWGLDHSGDGIVVGGRIGSWRGVESMLEFEVIFFERFAGSFLLGVGTESVGFGDEDDDISSGVEDPGALPEFDVLVFCDDGGPVHG